MKSIGYQKYLINDFVKKLKENHIDVLVDIRTNPYSRNLDYSREQLKWFVENAGIKYDWCRKLGGKVIFSEDIRISEIKKIIELNQNKEVCFMCCEYSINSCHRKEINEIIKRNFNIIVEELNPIGKQKNKPSGGISQILLF